MKYLLLSLSFCFGWMFGSTVIAEPLQIENEVVAYTIACKDPIELELSHLDDFHIDIGDTCRILENYTPVIIVRMLSSGPVLVRFNTSPVEYFVKRGSLL